MSTTELTVASYKADLKPIWCPGCGDYGALNPFYQALVECGIEPKNTVIVSGIGCSGRFPYFCKTYGFHGVHGRALPTAAGMKMASPHLNIFAVGGDGDGLGIGGGHIAHVARKNIDLTYILLDNSIYGLTKGQSSPTSPLPMSSKTAPYGYVEEPLNPMAMYLAYNASFVARGFSGKPKQLKDLFTRAIRHKGFSMVHIFSPCVTFNKEVTFKTFNDLVKEIPPEHDTANRLEAMRFALDDQALWTGVFHEADRPSMQDRLADLEQRAGHYRDLNELFDHFR
jgi:2-oxoglutarate/2-oxoacid ferredoxin oxidoreductase subunit beta